MKVIISHDVDHLFRRDHYRDLSYPKLMARSTIQLFQGMFGIKEWILRLCSVFPKERNSIQYLMEYDSTNNIKSTFFFGMRKGYGLTYSRADATKMIKKVDEKGFDVGVHGIEFENSLITESEKQALSSILGRSDFGIRMHYVHYTDNTFINLNKCGYLFDTTEFNKKNGYVLKNPYKVGDMWDFPLAIMDGYLPTKLEDKKFALLS